MAYVLDSMEDNIRDRAEYDSIVSGPILALAALMPVLISLMVFLIGAKYITVPPKLYYLTQSEVAFATLFVCFMIESYLIMLVFNSTYKRYVNHAKRDSEWRKILIGHADLYGLSTEKLLSIDQAADNLDRHKRYAVVYVLLAIATVSLILGITGGLVLMIASLYWIGNLFLNLLGWNRIDTEIYWDPLDCGVVMSCVFGTFVLCLILFLVVFRKVVTVPWKHESLQVDFTREFANLMSTKGIYVEPMNKILTKPKVTLSTALAVLTLGIGGLIQLGKATKDMNNHIFNQWDYETYLLAKLEHRDSEYDYGVESNLSPKQVKKSLRKEFRPPRPLIIAELFLVFMVCLYILKLAALSIDISQSLDGIVELDVGEHRFTMALAYIVEHNLSKVLTITIDVITLMLLLDAIIGLSSSKPTSWRKVTRVCITLSLVTIVSAFLTGHSISNLFDLNIYITLAIVYDLFLMMLLSESIKAYFTPEGTEIPSTKHWLLYVFYG